MKDPADMTADEHRHWEARAEEVDLVTAAITMRACADYDASSPGSQQILRRIAIWHLETIAALTAERDEARDWVRKMHKETQTLTCVYCGHAYPPGTPASGDETLTAHIMTCEKHPLRTAEAALVALKEDHDRHFKGVGCEAEGCCYTGQLDAQGNEFLKPCKCPACDAGEQLAAFRLWQATRKSAEASAHTGTGP